MPTVDLDSEEWQKIMAVLATAPWNIANPLLMKMGDQLRQQKSGNSKETLVPQAHLESKSTTILK